MQLTAARVSLKMVEGGKERRQKETERERVRQKEYLATRQRDVLLKQNEKPPSSCNQASLKRSRWDVGPSLPRLMSCIKAVAVPPPPPRCDDVDSCLSCSQAVPKHSGWHLTPNSPSYVPTFQRLTFIMPIIANTLPDIDNGEQPDPSTSKSLPFISIFDPEMEVDHSSVKIRKRISLCSSHDSDSSEKENIHPALVFEKAPLSESIDIENLDMRAPTTTGGRKAQRILKPRDSLENIKKRIVLKTKTEKPKRKAIQIAPLLPSVVALRKAKKAAIKAKKAAIKAKNVKKDM